jgi:hypothetical protein
MAMGGAAAGVAAATARARRRVISYFLSRNAVVPDRAVAFESDHRLERKFFERLRENGVIGTAVNGGFYIDAPKLDAWQRQRRKRLGMVLAGLATALAAGIGVGLLG